MFTSDSELNAVLAEFVARLQVILGDNLVGAYLQGSFAVGDWDIYSDVDWMVVIEDELTATQVDQLQMMHAELYDLPSAWAQHLEGSYFPRAILNNDEMLYAPLWYLDNGSRELVRSDHCNTLVVRWVVHEHGIVLVGEDGKEVVGAVSAENLRIEIANTMHEWGTELIAKGELGLNSAWMQPYVVLSYCRMLHSLHTGTVESKKAGAQWARKQLDAEWHDLIAHAWSERPDPWQKVWQSADPHYLAQTIPFIRYTLAQR